jgi:cytoskeletal protein RodZ
LGPAPGAVECFAKVQDFSWLPKRTCETLILPQRPDVAALRRSKGITLDQISHTTKISKRFLQAIEDDDFDQLPGGIFNTSYIRQYARAIDLDEVNLLTYYSFRTGTDVPGDNGEPAPRKKAASRGFRLPSVLARL